MKIDQKMSHFSRNSNMLIQDHQRCKDFNFVKNDEVFGHSKKNEKSKNKKREKIEDEN